MTEILGTRPKPCGFPATSALSISENPKNCPVVSQVTPLSLGTRFPGIRCPLPSSLMLNPDSGCPYPESDPETGR